MNERVFSALHKLLSTIMLSLGVAVSFVKLSNKPRRSNGGKNVAVGVVVVVAVAEADVVLKEDVEADVDNPFEAIIVD